MTLLFYMKNLSKILFRFSLLKQFITIKIAKNIKKAKLKLRKTVFFLKSRVVFASFSFISSEFSAFLKPRRQKIGFDGMNIKLFKVSFEH